VQGLLLRFSGLDADVEHAFRLISFFDVLVQQQAKPEELLRNAAVVAECAVGVQDLDGRFALRALPDGTVDEERAECGAASRTVTSGYQAWIGRCGDSALPLDEILLERLAIAFIATLGDDEATSAGLGDPALLELVVGQSTAAPERTRAVHLLGLTPWTEVTLLSVLGAVDAVDAFAAELGGGGSSLRRAIIGPVHAIAVIGAMPHDLAIPDGVTVGVGTTTRAVNAPTSWEKAVRALRYATASTDGLDPAARPIVYASELGPFELLAAQLRSSDIRGVADIDVLDELAAEPSGVGLLRTLEVVVHTGSLREAARKLYLHHNSVSGRVARAEGRLGYRITEPTGIARLGLALTLRRLRDTDLLG
jgi:hypothetical protein